MHCVYLSRESAEEGIPEVTQGEGKVFVEEVTEELAHSQVGPATVHQQQTFQVAELRNGEVTGQHSLHTLHTTDTNTNMCSCNRNTQKQAYSQ